MSIAPPSDIILDVAQAADPLKLQAATTKLAKAAAEGGATSFDTALAAATGTGASGPIAGPAQPFVPNPSTVSRPEIVRGQPSIGRKFEAVVLQNFIENILPKNSDLFGDAASADMGRGLMAEQIANEIARSGRIGIAKSVDQSVANAKAAAVPPTPQPQG